MNNSFKLDLCFCFRYDSWLPSSVEAPDVVPGVLKHTAHNVIITSEYVLL